VLGTEDEGVNALMSGNGGDDDTDMFGEGFNLGMEEFGFTWPADSTFNPSTTPLWLQEASFTDLGLPVNGNDGIFLNGPNWTVDLGPMPEAW
jgi:hypothetical protein